MDIDNMRTLWKYSLNGFFINNTIEGKCISKENLNVGQLFISQLEIPKQTWAGHPLNYKVYINEYACLLGLVPDTTIELIFHDFVLKKGMCLFVKSPFQSYMGNNFYKTSGSTTRLVRFV